MSKVSVIIPYHNANAYLARCVDSLMAQSAADMEFIFVDDASTDGSTDLVKKQIENSARKASCIFASTAEKSGPGAARNLGLSLASGDYVAFFDSDDRAEKRMYETLLAAAEKCQADLCCCAATMIFEKSERAPQTLQNPALPQGNFGDGDKTFFLTNYVAYLWTFLFRRDFLTKNKIAFPPENSAEDSYFIALAALCARRTASVEEPLYHYCVRQNSLSNARDPMRFLQKTSVFGHLIDETKRRGIYEDFRPEIDFLFIKKGYLSAAENYAKNASEPQPEAIGTLNAQLLRHVPDYKQNKHLRGKPLMRLLVCLLQRFPRLALRALRKRQ